MICKEVDIEPGDIVFSIAIPHIYDRHIEQAKSQIKEFKNNNLFDNVENKYVTFNIDNNATFDNVSWDNISIEGYDEFNHKPLTRYLYEIAI